MPGGSGLLEQMLKHWPAVIQRTLSLVEDCPSACATSCIDCLQNFRNSFYHGELNRHTAQECLREWGNSLRFSHEIPAVLPDDTQTQKPGNPPEQQLVAMHRAVRQSKPSVVVIDPIANLQSVGSQTDVEAMLTRVIDYLKTEAITALFTSLPAGPAAVQETDVTIPSLMDACVLLRLKEVAHERRREIAVLKSRGMAHSNQIREFVLTDHGFDLQQTPATGHGLSSAGR